MAQAKEFKADGKSTGGDVVYDRAGAVLLSQQPANANTPLASKPASNDWPALLAHSEARLMSLSAWRQSWWMQNWVDLGQYILPRRSIWLTQSAGGIPAPNTMSRGQPINSSIVDPTATYGVRVCAGGLMSGLASPSRPWFKIVPSLKSGVIDSAAREWLDHIEDVIYTILAGSNFYNSFAQECEDLIVFGTAPSIIYEDLEDVIRCYNPAVGEYYLATDATMRVDGLYRTFVMTVAQLVGFFGLDNCPITVKKLWAQKGSALQIEFTVAHAIEPNFEINDTGAGKLPGAFTWREVYWLYGINGEKPLSLRGFVDKPFTAGRWSVQSNDAYGRSPGMDVLPDVIQLQVETRRKAEAIEKMVRPPLLASIQLKNQPSSILPGHVTYVQDLGPGTGMRPIYEVNPDINGMMQDLQAVQTRILRGLFNDLFLMLEQAPQSKMTAYEVAQKVQEKLQVLGPVIEGLLSESLKPKLKRIYSIARRKGMIPEPPDSLKGVPIDLEFVSMLALAQKAAATGGLERLAALIGNMVPVFPEARDLLNVDKFIYEMNDLLGNPQKILRGPEETVAIREQQAKAMQQQQQMANMQQGVDIAHTGAQAGQVLSQTQVGAGGDALSMLLGGNS